MNEAITEHDIRSAHDAGTAWALGLKAGDAFMGARPQAERHSSDTLLIKVFIMAALDVLDHCDVHTNNDGVIIKFVNRRENSSTNL